MICVPHGTKYQVAERRNVPRETLLSHGAGFIAERQMEQLTWGPIYHPQDVPHGTFRLSHVDLHTPMVFHLKHLASLPIVC